MHITEFLIDIIKLLYISTAIGVVVVVLFDNRNPLKSLAWILVLISMPILGLVLYFFFGQNTNRLVIIKRSTYRRIIQRPLTPPPTTQHPIPKPIERLVQLNRHHAHAPLLKSDNIEIFHDGNECFEAIKAGILAARHHIHLLFYIFEDDETGREIQRLLIEKAQQGVEVRVIIDDVGCWRVPTAFFKKMEQHKVACHRYLRVVLPFLTSTANYRNHRKILVIDGSVGYIGSFNIADRYVKGNKLGKWSDTHIKLSGQAVRGLQSTFLIDWYTVSKQELESEQYFPTLPPPSDSAPMTQIVTGGPTDPWHTLLESTAMMIYSAQRYLYIQTPYYMPTESLEQALETIARSGVDVRVMLSYRSDSKMVSAASRSYLSKLLRAGIKVYLYRDGFLHSKFIISDDYSAAVGSTNFDYRSFEHNFEANAFIYNEKTCRRLKHLFMEDIKSCQRLDLKMWQKRHILKKFAESTARLASPIL